MNKIALQKLPGSIHFHVKIPDIIEIVTVMIHSATPNTAPVSFEVLIYKIFLS